MINEYQQSPFETAKYLNLNSAIIWQNNYGSLNDTSFFAWIGNDQPPLSEHTIAVFKIRVKKGNNAKGNIE